MTIFFPLHLQLKVDKQQQMPNQNCQIIGGAHLAMWGQNSREKQTTLGLGDPRTAAHPPNPTERLPADPAIPSHTFLFGLDDQF